MTRIAPRTRTRGHHARANAPFNTHTAGAEVLNLRDLPGDISAAALLEKGIVRVDRATKHGNPFPIGRHHGSREEVIERYRRHLWGRICSGDLPLEELAALANRPLACWCAPKPCHAEVLARAALWAAAEVERNDDQGASPDS